MKVKVINKSKHALPAYQTEQSAGMDVRATMEYPIELMPGERSLVPTGLFLEIPVGYEAQVRPRSGLAYKHGVTVLNSPGTLDADFRGEVKVLLINHDPYRVFTISPGERIGQLVFSRHEQVEWEEEEELSETERGAGGFGSSGTA